jgi:hypothetical protein
MLIGSQGRSSEVEPLYSHALTKIATVMGSRFQSPSAVRTLRSLVPTNNSPQSATNTFAAWLSSKLDGLAYIISPLLPESLYNEL